MVSENYFSMSANNHLIDGNVTPKTSSLSAEEKYSEPEPYLPRIDRQIETAFAEIEDTLENISKLIERRGNHASSLAWVAFILRTQQTLGALFDSTYRAEVSFRQQNEGRLQ